MGWWGNFAPHLLEKGVVLQYIQNLLEHESSKATEIYTHITKKSWDKIKVHWIACIHESLYHIFAAYLNGLTIHFQITMTTLYASSIYISLTFIARFTCSNRLVCCVCDNVSYGDKAGFHAIEGYWEGVTANLS